MDQPNLNTLTVDLYKQYIFPLFRENPEDYYIFAQVSRTIYNLVNEVFFKSEIASRWIPSTEDTSYSAQYGNHFRNVCHCLYTPMKNMYGMRADVQNIFTVSSMCNFLKIRLEIRFNELLKGYYYGMSPWFNDKTGEQEVQCLIEIVDKLPTDLMVFQKGESSGFPMVYCESSDFVFLSTAIKKSCSERTLKLMLQKVDITTFPKDKLDELITCAKDREFSDDVLNKIEEMRSKIPD